MLLNRFRGNFSQGQISSHFPHTSKIRGNVSQLDRFHPVPFVVIVTVLSMSFNLYLALQYGNDKKTALAKFRAYSAVWVNLTSFSASSLSESSDHNNNKMFF